MRKSTIYLFAPILVTMLAAAACGDDDTPQSSPTAPSAATLTDSAANLVSNDLTGDPMADEWSAPGGGTSRSINTAWDQSTAPTNTDPIVSRAIKGITVTWSMPESTTHTVLGWEMVLRAPKYDSNGNAIPLRWGACQEANNVVDFRTNNGCWTGFNDPNVMSQSYSNLEPGTEYKFFVRARLSNGPYYLNSADGFLVRCNQTPYLACGWLVGRTTRIARNAWPSPTAPEPEPNPNTNRDTCGDAYGTIFPQCVPGRVPSTPYNLDGAGTDSDYQFRYYGGCHGSSRGPWSIYQGGSTTDRPYAIVGRQGQEVYNGNNGQRVYWTEPPVKTGRTTVFRPGMVCKGAEAKEYDVPEEFDLIP